jgi:hypothetical protein
MKYFTVRNVKLDVHANLMANPPPGVGDWQDRFRRMLDLCRRGMVSIVHACDPWRMFPRALRMRK